MWSMTSSPRRVCLEHPQPSSIVTLPRLILMVMVYSQEESWPNLSKSFKSLKCQDQPLVGPMKWSLTRLMRFSRSTMSIDREFLRRENASMWLMTSSPRRVCLEHPQPSSIVTLPRLILMVMVYSQEESWPNLSKSFKSLKCQDQPLVGPMKWSLTRLMRFSRSTMSIDREFLRRENASMWLMTSSPRRVCLEHPQPSSTVTLPKLIQMVIVYSQEKRWPNL